MNRWLVCFLLSYFFSVTAWSKQDAEEATPSMPVEIMALKMPMEVANHLQRRLREGGEATSTTMEKIPDLLKSGKIKLLGQAKGLFQEDYQNPPLHRLPASGNLQELDKETPRQEGIYIAMGSRYEDGVIYAYGSIESIGKIEQDATSGKNHTVCPITATQPGVWTHLGTWQDGSEMTVVIARFTLKGQSNPSTGRHLDRSSSINYSICLLADGPNGYPKNQQEPISGNEALRLLKGATLMETGEIPAQAGGCVWRAKTQQSLPSRKNETVTDGYDLAGIISFSADQKDAETGLTFECNFITGTKRIKASCNRWMKLPVGELTLVPMDQERGAAGDRIILALTPSSRIIHKFNTQKIYFIHPSSQRILAQAAGLPIRPVNVEKGFENLPSFDKILPLLGLELPKEAYIYSYTETSCVNANQFSAAKIQEFIEKYIPAGHLAPEYVN